MSNANEAHFEAIIGATGCGKTTELKRRLGKLPARTKRRTFVWSPKEPIDKYAAMFPGSVVVSTATEVLEHLNAAGSKGAFHLVFIPTLNQKKDMRLFDVVCKMLMVAGNLVLVAEELHSVTTASYAPDGWRKLNFMGRGYGVYVLGLSQRPASVDKAFMGSLSFVHVGRLPHPDDQKAMAKVLGVGWHEVAALVGYQAIQRNMLTGEVVRRLT